MIQHTRFSALVLTLLVSGACERSSEPAGRMQPASAPFEQRRAPAREPVTVAYAPNDEAITTFARGQCEREARCDGIGAGKRFASDDACMQHLVTALDRYIGYDACPRGVRREQLSECLRQTSNDACHDPRAALRKGVTCSAAELCGPGA